MNNTIFYFTQVTCVFSVLYLMYILFLKKLTFHKANRFVLLILLPISIIIPFSNNLFPSLSSKIIEVPLFNHVTFNTINNQLQVIEQPPIDSTINSATLLIGIYWLVFSIYFIRILNTTRQLFLLRKKSTIQQKNGYQLVIANVTEIFSYFNWVFIPKHKFEFYDKQILEHEKAHIQLKHSCDIILTEIYIAFFWFNPLIYFYRKSLKSVHEFQADNAVLNNGTKTSHYIQLLMQSLEVSHPNNSYNYFNQTILEKRVIMMTKPKSNRFTKLKYILLLPISIFLISAFTKPILEKNEFVTNTISLEHLSKPPSLFPVQNITKDNITSFFGEKGKHPKLNKGIIHTGIDIRAKQGAPVIATADGIIMKASMEGNWGNLIVITHTDGYETWYAHLKEFKANKDQKVKKGEIIGYVGNTGRSTAPHLHYEVKHNGKHVNPLNYIE